jgi:hypothetical protein
MKMKKWIALLLMAVLTLSLSTAFAASPSKTVADVPKVLEITTSGEKAGDDFMIIILPDQPAVLAELAKINKDDPVSYFPQEVQEKLGSGLKLDEFLSITCVNYKPEYGDVTAVFQFTAKYTSDAAAATGFISGETVEWEADATEVRPEGTVAITFTQDEMVRMQQGVNTALAVLSAK